MNSILCIIFVTCLICLLGVNCRSLQVESDFNSGQDLNHDQESRGIFSWIKLKPIFRREVQRIKNLKDLEAIKLNQEPVESAENEEAINKESEEPTLSSHIEEAANLINLKSTESTFSTHSKEVEEENFNNFESTFSTHSKEENLNNFESTLSTHSKEMEDNLNNFESTESTLSTLSKEDEEHLINLESNYSTYSNVEENVLNKDPTETLSTSSDAENLYNDSVDKNTSQIRNTTSIKLELVETNQNEELISESDEPELESNITHGEKLESDSNLISYDILDNAISDILNSSGDSIIFQVFSDNTSAIESLDFDESTLLSEGGPIATLQEVSTVGFELLIDSETKQNLILAELLSSQSSLFGDEDFTEEDFSTVDFDSGDVSGSDLQEIETSEEETSRNPTTAELTTNEVNADKSSDQDGSVAEISSPGPEEPKCPESGWCLFWFLTEDMCAKDDHCPGSMKCCVWGCSKMCIDIDGELF